MNSVNIIGRLTKDVELKSTQSGISVTSFTVAVNRAFSKEKEADFIQVQAWKTTAEFASKYFVKGLQVGITGRLSTSSYEKDGVKHFTTFIVAENLYFADSKKEAIAITPIVVDDELPF